MNVMTNVVKIKRGLDINLKGKAVRTLADAQRADAYAVVPDCFHGIVPKVVVKVGDKVKAGTPLMTDKNITDIRFVSPVSGEVTAVNRGEKRKLISIVVKPDAQITYEPLGVKPLSFYRNDEVKGVLLKAGLWSFIKQRPYDRVANPNDKPRDIFVTAYNSAPLAPDFDFIVEGEVEAFEIGLDALTKLTDGKVYVGVKKGAAVKPTAAIETIIVEGPHPAGNVGVIINNVKPINKGEVVWTINAADVIFIGRLFQNGTVDFTRKVALTGSEMTERNYVKAIVGCTIDSLVGRCVLDNNNHVRLISGNVLTGTKVTRNDFLGAYDNQITAIPEGDNVDEFFGWATPGIGKYSVSRTYLSWLLGQHKEYVIDARIRGGRRAMIMSNEYDKVFPMDIYPEYLLKAIIAFDIDKMENLGIYEVAPEDFALCEFVDTSKIEIQKIVRQGLELLEKELQ